MTFTRLALQSLRYYWRTHVAVAFGVAAAVAVLAGSLLVGASVRESLRAIATNRLGAASTVVGAPQPFTEALADRMAAAGPVAPLLALTGVVRHESSSRRAGQVNVYGVDARFFSFHGVNVAAPTRTEALVSEDLAQELGVEAGDVLVVRLARPTDIPLDSLHGRREDAGRSIRLTVRGTLARNQMGDFTLTPGQGPARGLFLSLPRLQHDLAIEGRVNTLLVGHTATAAAVRDALASAIRVADLGLTVTALPGLDSVAVESSSGLVPDPIAAAVVAIAGRQDLDATPVLTWLATRLTAGGRTVPYSLISAVGAAASGDPQLMSLLASPGSPAPIVLNEWVARDLQVTTGAAITVEYLRWADEGRLVTEHATFRVSGVVPMRGLAVDRRWAPDYPGITTAADLSAWDPPFPIDLGLVRPEDEAYWDQYRTAPKAFIPLAAGQSLWRTRHGQLTSLRLRPRTQPGTPTANSSDIVAALTMSIERGISPLGAGFNVVDVRRQNVETASGATDFGAYFSYFSFFLMVSALLLSALFFRLSVEQRLSQIGVLRAAGFAIADIRRVLLIESVGVAVAGLVSGVALAIGWAALMMLALRTWWVDAVGTTMLRLHVDLLSLAVGAVGATIAAMLSIVWTVRALGRGTPRAQLTGSGSDAMSRRARPAGWIAAVALVGAAMLSGLSVAHVISDAGGFFGAGALVLVAGLAAYGSRLGGARSRVRASRSTVGSLVALGLRNASWRPGRSLTVAGLVAAAVFLLVSVDSFRKTAGPSTARDSGTGGFALIAESAVPIVHDLRTPEGREAVGLATGASDKTLAGVDIFSLRLRPGDDASCLNLYQPKQPRILGVPERLVREGRFSFAGSIATDDAGRRNPWTLLGMPEPDGVVPAIVDQTSLQYVLHASIGDVITVDADTSRPLRLRIVASLADSVMQGEILIAESAFRSVFPDIAGYRAFLVSVDPADPGRVDAVARQLESSLDSFGFDAQETSRRLDAFHRVENTYLSTFQALGGLGLMLGCVGLVAVVLRNVLERRRELALLGAAGFTGWNLQTLVAIEHMALVGVGLAIGVAAAALAVAPVALARGGGAPWHALAWILPVAAAGFLAAFGATRSLRRMPLIASLRSE